MNKLLSISTWMIAGALLVLPAISCAVDITNISGIWTSTTGGQNVTGVGTNQINWGGSSQTTAQKSGYNFTPSPNLFDIQPGTDFVLGTFTHINKVIPSSRDAITQAVLSVTLSIPNVINNLTLSYLFHHNETPNLAGHCPAGSVSVCDDIVTATSNPVVTKDFTLNGQLYTLTIKGFEVNGQTFTQFLTQENMNNTALLIADLTLVNVPEPATYLVLGSTLGLVLFLKKRQLKTKKATLEN